MKKIYNNIDLEIILYTIQDVITTSGFQGADYADSEAMSDMYGEGWENGLKK